MANWILYPVDRSVGRYTGSQVYSTAGAAYAPSAVDLNPQTVWLPGTASNARIYVNLGAAYNITGIFIGNHTLSGATVGAYKDTSFGSIGTVAGIDHSVSVTHDLILAVQSSGEINGQYFSIRLSGHDAADQIGVVALLDDDGKIEITQGGPRWPIGRSLTGGKVTLITPDGATDPQIIGGTRQDFILQLTYLPTASALGETIWQSLEDHNMWANGLVITTDSADSLTASPYETRAYYCDLVGDVDSGIVSAGGLSYINLPLRVKSKGQQ